MEDIERNGGPVANKRHSQLSESRLSASSIPGSGRASHRSSARSSYAAPDEGAMDGYALPVATVDNDDDDDENDEEPTVQPQNDADMPLVMTDGSGSKRSSRYGSARIVDTRLEIAPDGGCRTVPGGVPDLQAEVAAADDRSPCDGGEDGRGSEDGPEFHHNKYTRCVEVVQGVVHGFFKSHGRTLKRGLVVLLLIAFAVYLAFAIYTSPSGATVIVVLTILVACYFLLRQVGRHYGGKIHAVFCAPIERVMKKRWWRYCRWVLYGLVAIAFIVFLIVDVGSDHKRLTSAGGMLIFILIGFITSTNPSRVQWRPVIWGISLQFILGVLIMRWTPGFLFFRFMGDQVKVFLEYTDEGSKFVFGETEYLMHRMAFKVFPIVIYFSAVISIFYYWGLMQFIVCKIAWLMQFTMGTTAIESLNAATNIFIGMAESCVILRPFLPKLTKSELHAVMSGGFATVAGSYIALLVEVGASAEHLLSAAIMSAPAALAMGKLSYPETEHSQTKTEADVKMDKTPARNVVEAASNGAIAAIKVVASVAANLIAIIGLIAFFNATLSYLGARVGFPQLTFQLICSYVFWPLAAIMGVEVEDAGKVASLLGTKVFVDEFISFRDLGIMVDEGNIAERSRVIATYACCGFGSIAAVGVYIGALVSVAPERRGDISEVALRAVVNGNIAGFLTACIAGVLYTGEDSLLSQSLLDAIVSNTTAALPAMSNSTLT